MGGSSRDRSPKGQEHLAPHHRTQGDIPFRTRLFRTWQATSDAAGPASDVLVSLLPGGKAGLPVVTPPPTSPSKTPQTSPSATPVASQAPCRTAPVTSRPATQLAPSGDNFLQRRCLKTLSEAVTYTEKFKNLCRRRFGSLIRAWRELLDPQGVGRVGFVKFCEAARLMGFERVSILWKVLDSDGSKFITLDFWDPPSYRALMEFRHICFREYGGLLETFRYALDLDGSGTCRKSVLAKFLRSFEYMGDVDTLWAALDNGRGGFITVEELGFLLHWTGERFSTSAMDRDFAFRGERLKRAQEERRLERQKRQAEFLRQRQERSSITDQRMLRQTEAPRPFTSDHIRQLVMLGVSKRKDESRGLPRWKHVAKTSGVCLFFYSGEVDLTPKKRGLS
eukprot:symbB.v1.2.034935.t1/scaffold4601.1/size37531/1